MKFYSKRDIWTGVFLLGLVASILVSALRNSTFSIWHIAVPLVFLILYWILAGTKFMIEEDNLFIKSGPYKYKIKISEIIYINMSRKTVSSPSLLFGRIEIKSEYKYIVISPPNNKISFLKLLKEKNSNIKFN